MDLILWRHAEAEPENGGGDLARELTAKGRRQAQKSAAALAAKLPAGYLLWASQAERSRQTAAALREPDSILPALNPDADPRLLPRLLQQAEAQGVPALVIVGHQPWIGSLCAFLLNQNWLGNSYWSVKKSAFWWFECRGGIGSDGAAVRLRLMLAPAEL